MGKKKFRVNSVVILHKLDESPDLSHLGEYTSTWSEGCIDRMETGDWSRNEHRYWKPGCNHYPHNPKNWAHVSPQEIEQAFQKMPPEWQARWTDPKESKAVVLDQWYVWQDYQRMESLNRGDWHCIGIIAKAEIVSPQGVCQTIRSGGLWGVESDSDEGYLKSVEDEELATLENELAAMGIGRRAIEHAFKHVKRPSD